MKRMIGLLMLMVMGLMVGVGCGGKEIEVVKKDNEEYEIYRDEANNKPIKHGYYKEYYDDGSYKGVGQYVDDKYVGKWVWYYENGEVEIESNYKDGIGKFVEYYGSGKVRMKYGSKDEMVHGKEVEYYENGQVEKEGNYVAGEKEGKWVEYDEKGNITDEDCYKNNEKAAMSLCE